MLELKNYAALLANGGNINGASALWIALSSIVGGLMAVAIGAYASSRITLKRVQMLQERFTQEIRRVRVGAILCDYANVNTLESLAGQYNVSIYPDELEKTFTRKKSGQVEVGKEGIGKIGLSEEAGVETRVLYRLPVDLNMLAERVIEAVSNKETVRTDLTSLPTISFSAIEKVATERGELNVQILRDELVAAHMKSRLVSAFREKEYVLIEANWLVTSKNGCAILRLVKPVDVELEFQPVISLEVEVPVEISSELEVVMPSCRRFKTGREVTASVFGNCTSHDQDQLVFSVTPIVVFERHGKGALKDYR